MQTETGEILAKFNKSLTALESHYSTLSEEEKTEINTDLDNLPKQVEKRIKTMKTLKDDSDEKFLAALRVPPVKRPKKAKNTTVEQPA